MSRNGDPDEPYEIDPGSEDPGSSIEQSFPPPAPPLKEKEPPPPPPAEKAG